GSDSITLTNYITVNALPNIPSVSSNKPLSLCIGDSIILSCDSNAVNYQWMNNDVNISGANQKTLTVIIPGNYRVKIFNTNNCSAISPVTSVLPTIAAPIITPSVSGNGFCFGTSLQLNSNASVGNHWYKNGTSNPGDTNFVYTTLDSGTYSVNVILNGCNSPMSQALKFTLFPKPPALTITGKSSSTVFSIDTFNVAFHTGSVYTWTVIGGNIMSGVGTNQLAIEWQNFPNGAISVTEINSNGCSGDPANALVTLAPIGVKEISSLNNFRLFPNPADKMITIEFENSLKQNIEISLVNVLGQKMYGEKINVFAGPFSKQINVSDLSKGIYFMEVKTGNGSKKMKVVIE
ncbi:MAG: T9SS type A sorting domain-containing protein, partial [Bacteroidia bacterium]